MGVIKMGLLIPVTFQDGSRVREGTLGELEMLVKVEEVVGTSDD